MTVFETDKIPSIWVNSLNEYDAVITFTKFGYKQIFNSGVTVPIYVVPHGVDFETFYPNLE